VSGLFGKAIDLAAILKNVTTINHVLSGAVIALAIRHPWVAIPVAVASHFLLDMMPHFGGVPWFESWNKKMALVAVSDVLLSIACLATIMAAFPTSVWLILACAIGATLPDWPWVLHYRFGWRHPYFDWHQAIQRYERPWGAYVEVGFVLFAISALMRM